MSDTNLQFDPLKKLILAYAKSGERDRYALIFALDSKCADIIRSTSEILIGQMRLTWWRDILTKPVDQRPAGEPLVETINELEENGRDLAPLLRLIEGWEVMLDDFPWNDRQFDQYASHRGEGFFAFAAGSAGALSEDCKNAAQAWALWDFARYCSDEAMRVAAFEKSRKISQAAGPVKFDRSGRPLSILYKLAAADAKRGELSNDLYRPSVAAKIIWHGVTGF